MSYLAVNPQKFIGQSVGNGECIAFVREAANLPQPDAWQQGRLVRGATLVPGTVIATFDRDGRYTNDTHRKAHAAIYLAQSSIGIEVLDQRIERKYLANGMMETHITTVGERTLYFENKTSAVSGGENYYVVE